jgi:hypothetical protein
MTEKFSICIAIGAQSPKTRREFLRRLAASAAPLIAPPTWMMRIRGHELLESAWTGGPIDDPLDWIICLYPEPHSSAHGAWLIESVRDREVWTLSLPLALVKSRSSEVMDLLWSLSETSLPCVAGREYSMAAILRNNMNAEHEAESNGSLASHVVVKDASAFDGWLVSRRGNDRVLLARSEQSFEV